MTHFVYVRFFNIRIFQHNTKILYCVDKRCITPIIPEYERKNVVILSILILA